MNNHTESELIFIVSCLIGICVFAFIGRLIGQKRGQEKGGATLGALLGPVGLVGAAFLPDKRLQCPACKGRVPDDARKCMHCGGDLALDQITSAKDLTFELFKREYTGEIPFNKYGWREQDAMFKQWREQQIQSLKLRDNVTTSPRKDQ